MRVTAFKAALCAAVLAPVDAVVAGPDRADSRGESARRHGKVLRQRDDLDPGIQNHVDWSGHPGAATYNLGTLTVMPGMIDVHAHVGWHFDKDGRYAAGGHARTRDSLCRRERVRHVAGRLHDDSESRTGQRRRTARGHRPWRAAGSAHPDVDPSVQRAQRHARRIRAESPSAARADGADVVKIFASASIRDGGKQTMTDEQLQAACGEANALGLRTMVHAHSPESIKASVNAGCKQIEHGVFATDEVLKLMADKGVYFDPNVGVVLQNYLENKAHYLGIGNYNEEGFAFMEKGLALNDGDDQEGAWRRRS